MLVFHLKHHRKREKCMEKLKTINYIKISVFRVLFCWKTKIMAIISNYPTLSEFRGHTLLFAFLPNHHTHSTVCFCFCVVYYCLFPNFGISSPNFGILSPNFGISSHLYYQCKVQIIGDYRHFSCA